MNKIADYDTYDYDYSTYWSKREYEHRAEVLVLDKLLKKEKGDWFLDIGGSFGRVTKQYYSKYSHPVIVDYSLKTLQKNYSRLKKEFPNIELIAANAYHLPFKDSSFDSSLMIRVLHHIERQDEYITEISRILKNNGIYIQEYANKTHIKAVIRGLVTLNLSIFNKEPYQQPNKQNYEGTKEGSKVLFLNYHPKYIQQLFKGAKLDIQDKYGCSYLRINFLKKNIDTETLVKIENILQETLSWSNISPSIFVKAQAQKKEIKPKKYSSLNEILACPKCKNGLIIKNGKAVCKKCKNTYLKKKSIWDFRI